MSGIAYKVFTPEEWVAFTSSGVFAGAPIDLADGYIHLSAPDQLEETIARHFAGLSVCVAGVDLGAYGHAIRWEKSRGGALFPHLYGEPLRLETVTSVEERAPA